MRCRELCGTSDHWLIEKQTIALDMGDQLVDLPHAGRRAILTEANAVRLYGAPRSRDGALLEQRRGELCRVPRRDEAPDTRGDDRRKPADGVRDDRRSG